MPAAVLRRARHAGRQLARQVEGVRAGDVNRGDNLLSSLDLGRGGIAIRTLNPLDLNDKVRLRFRVPGSNSEIYTEARIVWRISGAGIGLQFEEVTRDDQATMARFVDTYASREGIFAVCSQCGALLRVALEDRGLFAVAVSMNSRFFSTMGTCPGFWFRKGLSARDDPSRPRRVAGVFGERAGAGR